MLDARPGVAAGHAVADRARDGLAGAGPVGGAGLRLTWEFFPLDESVFPAVRLAREVGASGGSFPAVYNAANEVAVDAFHDGAIRFVEIVDTIERVVGVHNGSDFDASSVDGVLRADTWARAEARRVLNLEPTR